MNITRGLRRWWRGHTFDEALSMYEAVLLTRPYAPKTLQQRRSELKHIRAALCGRTLGSIEPHHVAALVRRLADDGKLVTAQHVLAAVADILNEALLRGWVISNVALHVRRPRAPVKRQRLALAQWQDILVESAWRLPPWFGAAMKLALVTGQRRSDLVRMRFDHIHNNHLHIIQYKTEARIALPLALRLDVVGLALTDVIQECREYAPSGEFLLRPMYRRGASLGAQSLSNRFWQARQWAGIHNNGDRAAPSLHEVRSLSARLYREQGVDIRTLLGHRRQSTTDMYDDDRGLDRERFRYLVL